METFLILNYPKKDLDEISRLVRDRESFVVLIVGADIFEISSYLLATKGSNFTAIFDRNIYTRITALVRGEAIKSEAIVHFRWAAAVLAFCQIADIKLDYYSSLQEYAATREVRLLDLTMSASDVQIIAIPKL